MQILTFRAISEVKGWNMAQNEKIFVGFTP